MADKQPDGTSRVPARRLSTAAAPGSPEAQAETVEVITEVPLAIDVEGVETYTILGSPTDRRALAVGFLFTEGVIDSLDDIAVLKSCDDDSNTVRVRLKGEVPRLDDSGRNLLIVSSCGACGDENLRKRIDSLPAVGDALRIEAGLLRRVNLALSERQPMFRASGGAHAAAVFDKTGTLLAAAEDSGRHNALDKAIGKCLLEGIPLAGRGVMLTSRLSLEMVSKCARAGVELVAGVSAATSLAIEVAEGCNVTLCAFVRETRATVFTHSRRIIGAGG